MARFNTVQEFSASAIVKYVKPGALVGTKASSAITKVAKRTKGSLGKKIAIGSGAVAVGATGYDLNRRRAKKSKTIGGRLAGGINRGLKAMGRKERVKYSR